MSSELPLASRPVLVRHYCKRAFGGCAVSVHYVPGDHPTKYWIFPSECGDRTEVVE